MLEGYKSSGYMPSIRPAFMTKWLMEILKIPGRTASDKVLCNKAFNISKNQKYDLYQRCLASVVYKYFDKKSGKPKNESAAT